MSAQLPNIEVPNYISACTTFRDAALAARAMAIDLGCIVEVVRRAPPLQDQWRIMAPAWAIEILTDRQKREAAAMRDDYNNYEVDRRSISDKQYERDLAYDVQLQEENWRGRYGTQYSAPGD